MVNLLLQTATHALMVTGFVFMMMVVIEYLNVSSRGIWQRGLRGIPCSTFLASSIVQDGHGMLPLLAESRRAFLKVKTINLVVGLLTGFIGFTRKFFQIRTWTLESLPPMSCLCVTW